MTAVEALVAAVAGGAPFPPAVVVAPGGFGKTTLLDALAAAAGAGRVVHRLTGRIGEVSLAYGAVEPLLGADAVDVVVSSAPAAASRAALRAALAALGPGALVLVDDAHWCDAESLALLAVLVGRASSVGACLVVAHRPTRDDDALHALDAAAARDGSLVTLDPPADGLPWVVHAADLDAAVARRVAELDAAALAALETLATGATSVDEASRDALRVAGLLDPATDEPPAVVTAAVVRAMGPRAPSADALPVARAATAASAAPPAAAAPADDVESLVAAREWERAATVLDGRGDRVAAVACAVAAGDVDAARALRERLDGRAAETAAALVASLGDDVLAARDGLRIALGAGGVVRDVAAAALVAVGDADAVVRAGVASPLALLRAGRWAEAATATATANPTATPDDPFVRAAVDVALARRTDDPDSLVDAWTRAAPVAEAAPVDLPRAAAAAELAVAAARAGDASLADALARRVHAACERAGHPPGWTAWPAWHAVERAVVDADPERAAAAAGHLAAAAGVDGTTAVVAALAAIGSCWPGVLRGVPDAAAVADATRAGRGAGLTWEAARLAGGAALRVDDAAASARLLALGRELLRSLPAVAPAGAAGSLTPREADIGRLILDGLTQKDIAGRLFLAPKTIEHAVASIRRKLAVANRAELHAALRRELAQA